MTRCKSRQKKTRKQLVKQNKTINNHIIEQKKKKNVKKQQYVLQLLWWVTTLTQTMNLIQITILQKSQEITKNH